MRQRTRDEWMRLLESRGIPCSPVHSLGELSAHPHTQASGMVLKYRNHQGRELRGVAMPLRLEGQRPGLRSPPPSLGQDTEAVLLEHGFSRDQVNHWLSTGVVGSAGADVRS